MYKVNLCRIGIPFAVLFALLLLVIHFPLRLSAQAQNPSQDSGKTQAEMATAPVIKKESRLVLVDAVVTDRKGNYVQDLKQDEFRVYEDNKEQPITSFSFGSDPSAPNNAQK